MSVREEFAGELARLAGQGVFVGTSSWKYPGWKGLVYDEARYATRGRFSTKRFNAECLAEYAEVFPSVGVDHTFYDWPRPEMMRGYADATPERFTFSLKVTEAVTVKRFPKHDRYGERAGRENEGFLRADLFAEMFLRPSEELGAKRGALIFEFGQFPASDFPDGEAFASVLAPFLARLPRGPMYAVEVRNRNFLGPAYFSCLTRHDVAHVFASWTRMPSIGEQLDSAASFEAPFHVARALLAPGRLYEAAVERFQPYDRIQDENPQLRADLARLIEQTLRSGRRAFIYVNNRAEGCAPLTIQGMLKKLRANPKGPRPLWVY